MTRPRLRRSRGFVSLLVGWMLMTVALAVRAAAPTTVVSRPLVVILINLALIAFGASASACVYVVHVRRGLG